MAVKSEALDDRISVVLSCPESELDSRQMQMLCDLGKAPLGFRGEFLLAFDIEGLSKQNAKIAISMYFDDIRNVQTSPGRPVFAIELCRRNDNLQAQLERVKKQLRLGRCPLVEVRNRTDEIPPQLQFGNSEELLNCLYNLIENRSKISQAIKELSTIYGLDPSHAQKEITQEVKIISEPSSEKKNTIAEIEVGEKFRFLQIQNFYQGYLDQFYSQRPHLVEASLEENMAQILADGFCSAHIHVQTLQEYGYEAMLIVANNPVTQLRFAEKFGLKTKNPNSWRTELVKQQIELLQPDVVYFNEPLFGFDGKFIQSLSFRPKLVIGWRASTVPADVDWTGYDIILSNISGVREIATQIGAKKAISFSPGFPTWIHKLHALDSPSCDIVFSGQLTSLHQKRTHYLQSLAVGAIRKEWSLRCYCSEDKRFFSPEFSQFNKEGRFGVDYFKSLREGRICFDARGTQVEYVDSGNGKRIDLFGNEAGSMRLFEATGMGAFLLADHFESLGKYFEIGKEIETFKDEKELIEKVRYYLAHPSEASEIAEKGRIRCHKDHDSKTRTNELISRIQLELGFSRSLSPKSP